MFFTYFIITALKFEQQGTASLMKRQDTTKLTGSATFYSLGLTACGTTPVDTDMVVALPVSKFGSLPNQNNNPSCEKCITVTGTLGSSIAKVQDVCGGCPGENDVDLSPELFKKVVGDESVGRKDVTWTWSAC